MAAEPENYENDICHPHISQIQIKFDHNDWPHHMISILREGGVGRLVYDYQAYADDQKLKHHKQLKA